MPLLATVGGAWSSDGDRQNDAMADRRHYIPGCSPAALDAAGHRHYLALVRLRLGDPVAFATLHVSADDYRPMDRGAASRLLLLPGSS